MSKPRRAPRRSVNGVLLLDKPQGFTSNAALQKARWLFNASKAGHTGTLDPMATGLLPLCFGEATKFSSELLDADKTYLATVDFGVTTDTFDAEGQVTASYPVTFDEAELLQALSSFIGPIQQIPPMYSALKRDGKPLYEYAREGIELDRAPRSVVIESISVSAFDGKSATLEVSCSKGTYIRTLADDLGRALGCGAHLSGLRRTRIGRLTLDGAVTPGVLEGLSLEGRDALLAPVDALVSDIPRAELSEAETHRVVHGQGVRWTGVPGERWRYYAPSGTFLGIGMVSADGWLNPRRLVATDHSEKTTANS